MRCDECPNRQSGTCGKRGKPTAPITLVGMSPDSREELEQGVPFVGGSGKVLAAALAESRYSLDDAYCVNTVNCFPQDGENLSHEQIRACRKRFVWDLAQSTSEVLVPLGGDALRAVCGFSGTNNGISAWRGYLVHPNECQIARLNQQALDPSGAVPPSVQWIVPAFHPSYIMRTGFRYYHYLVRDLRRATRALNGNLQIVEAPTKNAPQPDPDTVSHLGIDIETVGFIGPIDQIGLSW